MEYSHLNSHLQYQACSISGIFYFWSWPASNEDNLICLLTKIQGKRSFDKVDGDLAQNGRVQNLFNMTVQFFFFWTSSSIFITSNLTLGDSMISDFMGHRSLSVRESMFDGTRSMKSWSLQLGGKNHFFCLISLNKESRDVWHFISKLRTVLYQHFMVPDREGRLMKSKESLNLLRRFSSTLDQRWVKVDGH